MDFEIGKREVEPLEQAEIAEVKVGAVDEALRIDVALAVSVDQIGRAHV